MGWVWPAVAGAALIALYFLGERRIFGIVVLPVWIVWGIAVALWLGSNVGTTDWPILLLGALAGLMGWLTRLLVARARNRTSKSR